MTALAAKRKRSSDAVSESGTCHTEQTEGSTPRRDVDEKSQLLAQKREQHAEAKVQLEEQLKQAEEQKQHVAAQLEQLEGCEGSRDGLGISDLQAQLQAYTQQEQQALEQLTERNRQFEADVADILGIPAEQQSRQLAAAVQEQQQLQEAEVQQLVVEQQLARPGFAVTDSTKHQAKKARLDRMSQVWDWLQDSSAAAAADAAGTAPGIPAADPAADGRAAAAAAAGDGEANSNSAAATAAGSQPQGDMPEQQEVQLQHGEQDGSPAKVAEQQQQGCDEGQPQEQQNGLEQRQLDKQQQEAEEEMPMAAAAEGPEDAQQ